jgi:hypothetical protein
VDGTGFKARKASWTISALQGIRQDVHSALLQFESLMIVVASILFHHCFVEIHILGGDGDW